MLFMRASDKGERAFCLLFGLQKKVRRQQANLEGSVHGLLSVKLIIFTLGPIVF